MKRGYKSTAKNQAEFVKETLGEKELFPVVELKLAGTENVINMEPEELANFFQLALKARTNIRSMEFVYGDYNYKEQISSIPGSNQLHLKTLADAAIILANMLTAVPNIIGFFFKLEQIDKRNVCTTYVYIGEKTPEAPVYENGTLVGGDAEYNPRISVQYINKK